MEQVLQHGLSNAATAAVLAILAAVATRLWRNPHFAYALCLIVLVRLVAPPLLPVTVPLPAWMTLPRQASPRIDGTAVAVDHPFQDATSGGMPTALSGHAREDDARTVVKRPNVPAAGLVAQPQMPEPRGAGDQPSDAPRRVRPGGDIATVKSTAERKQFRSVATVREPLASVAKEPTTPPRESSTISRLSLAQLLLTVWIAGTFCYLFLVGVRAGRFARALRASGADLPEWLLAEAASVAATVGLRRPPRMAMITAALPPFIWPGWRPTVFLPQALVESLSVLQRRLLLVHEFVHIRRRDHRVRWFQIGVVAAWWWNPIAWWAARRLEQAEEECCDAAVLRFHPDQSQSYGQTLVAVTEFLSTGTLPAPALSIGSVRKNHLTRRLTMILNGPRWPGLSKTRIAICGIVGAALIAVTWKGVTAKHQQAATDTNRAAYPTVVAHKTETETPGVEPSPTSLKADAPLATLLNREPLPAKPDDDDLQKLLKDRYNAALAALQSYQLQYELKGTVTAPLCAATRDFFEAQLALVSSPRGRIRVLEAYVDFANNNWKQVDAKLKAGLEGGGSADEALARSARIEAEISLNRFRAAASGASTDRTRLNEKLDTPTASQATIKVFPLQNGDAASIQRQLEILFGPSAETPAPATLRLSVDVRTNSIIALGPPDTLRAVEAIVLRLDNSDVHRRETTAGPAGNAGTQLQAALQKFETLNPAPGDNELQRLSKERYNVELHALRLYEHRYEAGTKRVDALFAVTRNLVNARLDLTNKPEEKNQIGQWFTEYARVNTKWKQAEAKLVGESVTGVFSPVAESEARAARYEAEIKLIRLLYELKEKPAESAQGVTSQQPNPSSQTTHSTTAPQTTKPAQPAEGLADMLAQFEVLKPAPGDDEQRKLLKERHNAALLALKVSAIRYEAGSTTAQLLCHATRNFFDVKLALINEPLDKAHVANWYYNFALMTWRQALVKLSVGGENRANKDDEMESRNAVFEATAIASKINALFPALLTSKPLEITPQDDERRKLLKQRYNAALQSLKAFYARREVDPEMVMTNVIAAARQLLAAEVALGKTQDIVGVYERYLQLMKFFETEVEARFKAGSYTSRYELESAHEARLDAEIKLLDAKGGTAPALVPAKESGKR